MRKRFEPQYELGILPIEDTLVVKKSRDAMPQVVAALKHLYTTPFYNERILDVLEKKILKGKKNTGRKGLNLWVIFVLAQFRLAFNLSYDRLHYMSVSDKVLRQLLGIETETGFKRIEIDYQRIIDNVSLLDDETLKEINVVIVEMGHDVFKRKRTGAIALKNR